MGTCISNLVEMKNVIIADVYDDLREKQQEL
jgi:hypothetical protein